MEEIVEVSARHIHLTPEDCKILFGKEDLIQMKSLSQQNFAAEETVEIEGAKDRIKSVRVVGPIREYSQVEISETDAIKLGIEAPLRISGDLPGASIKVKGTVGSIDKEIAIVAKRHFHLPAAKAEELSLKNGDKIKVQSSGDRALLFDEVVVRVGENFDAIVHLDTDEANAAGIKNSDKVSIVT